MGSFCAILRIAVGILLIEVVSRLGKPNSFDWRVRTARGEGGSGFSLALERGLGYRLDLCCMLLGLLVWVNLRSLGFHVGVTLDVFPINLGLM